MDASRPGAGHRPRRRRHQQHPGQGDEARGVPVFNAPGANANAVKELVLAGMLMAARNIGGAAFVAGLDAARPRPGQAGRGRQEGLRRLRAGRPDAGRDRPGQDRLPGGRRRDQAGHERARLRPGDHRRRGLEPALAGAKANSVNEVLKAANFVSLHVPLVDATRKMINARCNIGSCAPARCC
jgi:D-3-phosphoglycerate dehydrogenase